MQFEIGKFPRAHRLTAITLIATGWLLAAALAAGGCKPPGPQPAATAPASAQPATTRPAVAAETMRRAHVFISGNVQGVGFRAFTQAEARKRGLTGYVLNLPDGRVEAVIEGPSPKVQDLLDQLKQGPPGSRVDSTNILDEEAKGDFKMFRIDD